MKYFDYEYRVRYGDTDKLGISYYANYLVWFEAARTEYFRALGLPYTECEKKGYFLPVVEATVRYHAPSTYDDLLVIRTSVSRIRMSSMKFEYQAFHKEKQTLLATGFTVHAFVDGSMVPVKAPDEVRSRVQTHKLLDDESA
ncbi:MAG: acyl-CoA thioesterase [Candidatus Omnitrophica bacterium]|nr:acyl-CoA thioesterase [Candidatus Omnitrophota bacterium]